MLKPNHNRDLMVFQVKTFPEIDIRADAEVGLTPSQKNHRSTIQGVRRSKKIYYILL